MLGADAEDSDGERKSSRIKSAPIWKPLRCLPPSRSEGGEQKTPRTGSHPGRDLWTILNEELLSLAEVLLKRISIHTYFTLNQGVKTIFRSDSSFSETFKGLNDFGFGVLGSAKRCRLRLQTING